MRGDAGYCELMYLLISTLRGGWGGGGVGVERGDKLKEILFRMSSQAEPPLCAMLPLLASVIFPSKRPSTAKRYRRKKNLKMQLLVLVAIEGFEE